STWKRSTRSSAAACVVTPSAAPTTPAPWAARADPPSSARFHRTRRAGPDAVPGSFRPPATRRRVIGVSPNMTTKQKAILIDDGELNMDQLELVAGGLFAAPVRTTPTWTAPVYTSPTFTPPSFTPPDFVPPPPPSFGAVAACGSGTDDSGTMGCP